ncbi:MAG: hypothetical protein K0S47_2172 [Herbinix sp.]|jgi:uncharacterized protein (DUF362 family)|nr:hypothetical protein [Herbinix sp.]
MILSSNSNDEFCASMDTIGFKAKIIHEKTVLIKINLARPAIHNHPRTDVNLLSEVIHYVYSNGGTCAIAESANGYLKNNIEQAGLSDIVNNYNIKVIDLDFEEVEQVSITGEEHYIPKCFKNYGVRIAIPASSKRPNMIFSNNVKLFVGAVPRRMYQIDNKTVDWRPRVHIDLHRSVANIFNSIQWYSPFSFFINGGLAMSETKGEFRFKEILISNDGIELDLYVLEKYFNDFEIPDYLKEFQNK